MLQEENNATTIAMSKGKYNFLVILGINYMFVIEISSICQPPSARTEKVTQRY